MKISIITAVFNGSDTLADAFDSLVAQNHRDFELIVIDGASTDATMDVIQRYRRTISHLVSEPDRGIYDALNKGLRLASGDAVGFLHADDRFSHANVLSRIAQALENPEIEACYADLCYVDACDASRIIRHWRAGCYGPRSLGRGWMPPHPTFYARRWVYERFGAFDLKYRIAADYDCLLRFLATGRIRCSYIPEVLVHMRIGGASNRSFANLFRKSREDYYALRRNRVGGLGTLLAKNLRKLPQFLV